MQSMGSPLSSGTNGKVARLQRQFGRLFADKEIFFRSQGKVHFVRIARRTQIALASALALLSIAWLGTTLILARGQMRAADDRAAIEAKAHNADAQSRTVDAYRRSVDEIARDVARRQDALDDMIRSQFGTDSVAPDVVAPSDTPPAPASVRKPGKDKLSAVIPASTALRAAEARQTLFARRLARLIDLRAAKAAAAIRSFGLDPERIASGRGSAGLGGPYAPWPADASADDRALTGLARALARLDALERGLVAIPSGRPTDSPMLTSSYGYRRDPFNGKAAFHAGLDFPGHSGQPILAAAAGRVAYVGQRQGYGNVVEIDHGHAIMTRYAHLSGFTARPGQIVLRGTTVGRMGSTGRSTGPHLHFEVRLNGAPINPRRFLEVRRDVLKSQQIAKQRFAQIGSHGDRG